MERDEELIPARLRPTPLPRYARVNTMRGSLDNAVRLLCEEMGFHEVPVAPSCRYGDSPVMQDRSTTAFCRDRDVPGVLVFHPKAPLARSEMVRDGRLVLQDKSSCLPPMLLLQEKQAAAAPLTKEQRRRAQRRDKKRQLLKRGGWEQEPEEGEPEPEQEEEVGCPPAKRAKTTAGDSASSSSSAVPLVCEGVVDACAAPGNKTTFLVRSLLPSLPPLFVSFTELCVFFFLFFFSCCHLIFRGFFHAGRPGGQQGACGGL